MQMEFSPRTEHRSVCEPVALAVADAEGVSPDDLPSTLYDAIDPDALGNSSSDAERAVEHDLSVAFPYGDWNVHVRGDGEVRVIERPGVQAGGTDFPPSDR